MPGDRPPSFKPFTCPDCQALYHLVKVEAGPETVEHPLACRACGASLPSREGRFVLKYFLCNYWLSADDASDQKA
jgi:hypothetical protein